MSKDLVSRRHFIESSLAALSGIALPGCGGGGGGDATTDPVVTPPPAPPPASTTLATLSLQATKAGIAAFSASVLPLPGQVPMGSVLASPDDGALRSSVLSRWPDGSAAVLVVASSIAVTTNEGRTLRLQLTDATAGEIDIGAAQVAQLVSSVVVDLGVLGKAELRNFAAPERLWWANPQTVCVRYRAAVGAHPTLEAVVDVQAWAGRALVEVVVENGKIASTASIPVKPASVEYRGATVSVNDAVIATASSPLRGEPVPLGSGFIQPLSGEWAVSSLTSSPPSAPTVGQAVAVYQSPTGVFVGHAGERATWNGSSWSFAAGAVGQLASTTSGTRVYIWTGSVWKSGWIGGHEAMRAWYASTWVGGDPGVRVTQSHLELQKHPLLFKCDQPNAADLSIYAADTYSPWAPGRYRSENMGGGGDHEQIGPVPQWEARALQSGDARTWKATEASTLAFLGYACQYRDLATGLVPTFTQLAGKNMQTSAGSVGHWPSTGGIDRAYTLELAHHPAVGLMGFLARPSPIFIELAQKVAVWLGTWSSVDGVGVFGRNSQIRGWAWGMRSLAHATFLTPDTLPWRASAVQALAANVGFLDSFRLNGKALLGSTWMSRPDAVESPYSLGASGHGVAMWQEHYLITEAHKAASAQLLNGAQQTAFNTLADWLASQPVRWVNEQTNGAWRYLPYVTVLGRDLLSIDSLPTWGEQRQWWMTDAPPSVTGSWYYTGSSSVKTYSAFQAHTGALPIIYTNYFWAALVAAVERGVPGAAAAWATVQSGVTDLATWRVGTGLDPRWGSVPRNT
jgi:hypothetical protein